MKKIELEAEKKKRRSPIPIALFAVSDLGQLETAVLKRILPPYLPRYNGCIHPLESREREERERRNEKLGGKTMAFGVKIRRP